MNDEEFFVYKGVTYSVTGKIRVDDLIRIGKCVYVRVKCVHKDGECVAEDGDLEDCVGIPEDYYFAHFAFVKHEDEE